MATAKEVTRKLKSVRSKLPRLKVTHEGALPRVRTILPTTATISVIEKKPDVFELIYLELFARTQIGDAKAAEAFIHNTRLGFTALAEVGKAANIDLPEMNFRVVEDADHIGFSMKVISSRDVVAHTIISEFLGWTAKGVDYRAGVEALLEKLAG